MKDNRNMQTEIRDYRDGTRIISMAVQHFCRFGPIFARVAALLNKRFLWRLTADIWWINQPLNTALETLKAVLTEFFVLALPLLQGPHTQSSDACDKKAGYIILPNQADGTKQAIGRAVSLLHSTWNAPGSPYGLISTSLSESVLNLTVSAGELVRWRLQLSEF